MSKSDRCAQASEPFRAEITETGDVRVNRTELTNDDLALIGKLKDASKVFVRFGVSPAGFSVVMAPYHARRVR